MSSRDSCPDSCPVRTPVLTPSAQRRYGVQRTADSCQGTPDLGVGGRVFKTCASDSQSPDNKSAGSAGLWAQPCLDLLYLNVHLIQVWNIQKHSAKRSSGAFSASNLAGLQLIVANLLHLKAQICTLPPLRRGGLQCSHHCRYRVGRKPGAVPSQRKTQARPYPGRWCGCECRHARLG